MKWRNMRAGERRKFARNLEFNREARQIGVVGFCLARIMLLPLLALGLTALALHYQPHLSPGHLVMAGTPVLLSPNTDFLSVMDESDGMFEGLGKRRNRISKLDEKLDRFIRMLTNADGLRKHEREFQMKEAETTSDFPILFGTVLERTLLARYKTATADWRAYIKTGTQNDFRTNNLIGVFGLESALSKVPERGEYQADKLADGKVANQLYKYGRQFPLSWEALINDDLGAFSDVAARLANAALVTEYIEATKLFCEATGPISSLYSASGLAHKVDSGIVINKTGAVFSIDALADAVTAMRKQKDINGNPIIIDKIHLVTGPDLEIPVLRALSPGSLIAGEGLSSNYVTSENVVAKLGIVPHVNPYIPLVATTGTYAAKSWWLFGESGSAPVGAQMNFLRGHEAPEIVQRMSNKMSLSGAPISQMDGDFDSDSMAWRLRHVLGGTQIDSRVTYASDGQG